MFAYVSFCDLDGMPECKPVQITRRDRDALLSGANPWLTLSECDPGVGAHMATATEITVQMEDDPDPEEPVTFVVWSSERECPDCDARSFGHAMRDQEFEYGAGPDATVLHAVVPVWTCLACGSAFCTGDGGAEEIRQAAVDAHLASRKV